MTMEGTERLQRFICPSCGDETKPLFKGKLERGSVIEAKCHNRKCPSNKERTLVTVIAAS
jgi:hypothetical protein